MKSPKEQLTTVLVDTNVSHFMTLIYIKESLKNLANA